MIAPTSYGAVRGGNDDDPPADRSFDADRTYYLKDAATAPLTRRQRVRRWLSAAFPLVVAVLIMGGFAWFLLKDFNTLYPGRGGGSQDGGYEHVVPSTGKKSLDDAAAAAASSSAASSGTTPRRPDGTTAGSAAAACASHDGCARLGLIGNCCPTDKGVVLQCC